MAHPKAGNRIGVCIESSAPIKLDAAHTPRATRPEKIICHILVRTFANFKLTKKC